MSIQEWFYVCLFLKLCGVISNAAPVPDASNPPLKNIDRKMLLQKIDDLIKKYKHGEDVQREVEEELPDEVVMTEGYCTIWEYIKSCWYHGYQPEAVGTQSNPLKQHTFKRIDTADGSVPTYSVSMIAPTQTPFVKESGRHLSADQLMKVKKGAGKIFKDIQDSAKKVRFA